MARMRTCVVDGHGTHDRSVYSGFVFARVGIGEGVIVTGIHDSGADAVTIFYRERRCGCCLFHP